MAHSRQHNQPLRWRLPDNAADMRGGGTPAGGLRYRQFGGNLTRIAVLLDAGRPLALGALHSFRIALVRP